ncbi:NADH-quinone oxidoreductase subunit J [Candidatus Kapabacteria bacterium]|nr:NADH-quinone oxidoreductase subunit J [Candidatus Kapabacteria bacterium]
MALQTVFFWILGILAIAGAVGTISARNPVSSAMALVFHFFMLAGLYLTLQAEFIAVLQVLVYAGAIMVLVIFVIMLLNLGNEEKLKEGSSMRKISGYALGSLLTATFFIILIFSDSDMTMLPNTAVAAGSVEQLGRILIQDYLFHFEAITLILLVAVVGALILARKKPSDKNLRGEY